jgi:hypothetical protein
MAEHKLRWELPACSVYDSGGVWVGCVYGNDWDTRLHPDQLRRIVACVNFCRNLMTVEMENRVLANYEAEA